MNYPEPVPGFLGDDFSAVHERIESCVVPDYVFVDTENQVLSTVERAKLPVKEHSCRLKNTAETDETEPKTRSRAESLLVRNDAGCMMDALRDLLKQQLTSLFLSQH